MVQDLLLELVLLQKLGGHLLIFDGSKLESYFFLRDQEGLVHLIPSLKKIQIDQFCGVVFPLDR